MNEGQQIQIEKDQRDIQSINVQIVANVQQSQNCSQHYHTNADFEVESW
jgi:hypothetical protein